MQRAGAVCRNGRCCMHVRVRWTHRLTYMQHAPPTLRDALLSLHLRSPHPTTTPNAATSTEPCRAPCHAAPTGILGPPTTIAMMIATQNHTTTDTKTTATTIGTTADATTAMTTATPNAMMTDIPTDTMTAIPNHQAARNGIATHPPRLTPTTLTILGGVHILHHLEAPALASQLGMIRKPRKRTRSLTWEKRVS